MSPSAPSPLHEWTRLADAGRFGAATSLEDKTKILDRGEEATHAYFLKAGAVEIFQRSADGQGLLVKVLRAPALFGVLEVVADEEIWLESVRTYANATVHQISRAAFQQTLAEEPAAALECLRDTCAAFCSAARREPAAMAPVDVRLATVFLAYIHAASHPWDGGLQILGKRTQSDLAQTIGASERSVNACLKRWKEEGRLTKADGRYIIHDVAALETIAGDLAYCLL